MPHPIPTDLSQEIIDTLQAIERQFTITDQKLLDITSQFLDDFNAGLSQYNKPMAMMYVVLPHLLSFIAPQPTCSSLCRIQTNVRHWCA